MNPWRFLEAWLLGLCLAAGFAFWQASSTPGGAAGLVTLHLDRPKALQPVMVPACEPVAPLAETVEQRAS